MTTDTETTETTEPTEATEATGTPDEVDISVEHAGPLPFRDAVTRRVVTLQGGYLADRPDAVATLAQLRGGAGKLPADTPELWGLTVDLADCVYPEADDEQAETAIHIALTLYALHQQSRREERMHQGPMGWRSRDLGWAIRELMPAGEVDESLRKRFVQAGTAHSMTVLAYRLRGIVQLLRRAGIPLDYGLLAEQLLVAQRPGGMRRLRSAWGRGFAAYRPETSGPGGRSAAGQNDNQATPASAPAPQAATSTEAALAQPTSTDTEA